MFPRYFFSKSTKFTIPKLAVNFSEKCKYFMDSRHDTMNKLQTKVEAYTHLRIWNKIQLQEKIISAQSETFV